MAEDNVVVFNNNTFGKIDPDEILKAAKKKKWEMLILIGLDDEDNCILRSSTGDYGEILVAIEVIKAKIVKEIGG
jgi:hypothetical protein